mmetsp:Transcript_56870/g.123009  ORF Transcript_56870/g.123009 Transcript_56870/m.123009 type:complete len:344 (+) Transcript_56870:904-1935(+)
MDQELNRIATRVVDQLRLVVPDWVLAAKDGCRLELRGPAYDLADAEGVGLVREALHRATLGHRKASSSFYHHLGSLARPKGLNRQLRERCPGQGTRSPGPLPKLREKALATSSLWRMRLHALHRAALLDRPRRVCCCRPKPLGRGTSPLGRDLDASHSVLRRCRQGRGRRRLVLRGHEAPHRRERVHSLNLQAEHGLIDALKHRHRGHERDEVEVEAELQQIGKAHGAPPVSVALVEASEQRLMLRHDVKDLWLHRHRDDPALPHQLFALHVLCSPGSAWTSWAISSPIATVVMHVPRRMLVKVAFLQDIEWELEPCDREETGEEGHLSCCWREVPPQNGVQH